MKILKNLSILIFCLSLSSCRWFSSISTTFFAGTSFKVPDGTPVFQKGFKDGCSTVLYARGNDFYRSRYKYRYEPNLIGNSEYRFGHQRGYSWCFQNVIQAQTGPFKGGGFSKFLFVYGNDSYGFDASPGSINDTGLFGSSANPWSTEIAGGLNETFNVFQKGTNTEGVGGVGESTFGTNPLWSGGNKGQFLGWY